MIGKLILLLIVGFGIAMAVPETRGRIVAPVRERIYLEMTPRRLEMIANRLDSEPGALASVRDAAGLEDWILRNTSIAPRDPWGNRYYVERRGDGFVLGSSGPDGVRANGDDITASRRTRVR